MYVERANFCIVTAHWDEKCFFFFASFCVWKTQQMTFLVLKSVPWSSGKRRRAAGVSYVPQRQKSVTPLLTGGSRSHRACLSAATTLSCEIHPNVFRITELQKPSVEKISLVI